MDVTAMKARLAKYDATADAYLRAGDSLGTVKPAESRRLLRECRVYRLKARALRAELSRISDTL